VSSICSSSAESWKEADAKFDLLKGKAADKQPTGQAQATASKFVCQHWISIAGIFLKNIFQKLEPPEPPQRHTPMAIDGNGEFSGQRIRPTQRRTTNNN
jgi:hypothetical protein